LATAPVTMLRDPIFESVTKDGAPIEDEARETPDICSTSGVQWFLVGGWVAIILELMGRDAQLERGGYQDHNRQTELRAQAKR
jgi:hypothetical protein